MTIVVEAVAPTVSVTVTVMVSVPAAALLATVTIPELLSILIPVVAGEILNRLVPVPNVDVKAVEVFETPTVVVIFDPPPIATIESTVITTLIDLEIFKLSVAVTLSLIVPTERPASKVIAPEFASIEI